MIILGCDISSSIQFSRSGTSASGTGTSQLSYLKDGITRVRYFCTLPSYTVISVFMASATRRSRSVPPCRLHRILRGVLPGLRARSDDLHDLVNRVSGSSLFRHDPLLSLVLPTPLSD